MTYDEILGLLPPLDEFEEFRLALAGVAEFDPAKEWDRSRSYSTVDQRVLAPEQVQRTLREAEGLLHLHVQDLFAALPDVFEAYEGGRLDAAAYRLVELGEQFEDRGRFHHAGHCFRSALNLTLPLSDKLPQILALRRVARVALAQGDLPEAAGYYERSAALARDSGDLRGEVIARTGEGNVRAYQGALRDAESCYLTACELIAEGGDRIDLSLERGQLCNNLAMVTSRLGRAAEAEKWFARAAEHWEEIDSPLDLGVWKHNLGLLRHAMGSHGEAAGILRGALDLEIPAWLRSLIASDLAECVLQDGDLAEARRWGRVAEQHALSARSPFHVATMYKGLGNIARAAGEEDGFIFFEKALQIARARGYPLLEGETLLDYAAMRGSAGGGEEAEAYLERAHEIFEELGAEHDLERARADLRKLRGDPAAGGAVS